MNPTPSGAQALDSAPPPNEIQNPTDTPKAPKDLGLFGSLTPLGEPITKSSAKLLAEDPLKWLQQYWLNISVVGMLRGEDVRLLALGIKHARNYFLDSEIENDFDETWCQYEDDNKEACVEQWERMTLESEEAQPYLRDIDRMLVQSRFKNNQFLTLAERKMLTLLRAGKVDIAQQYFDGLGQVYQKLEAWRVAENEELENDDSDVAQWSLNGSENEDESDSDQAHVTCNDSTDQTPALGEKLFPDEWIQL